VGVQRGLVFQGRSAIKMVIGDPGDVYQLFACARGMKIYSVAKGRPVVGRPKS